LPLKPEEAQINYLWLKSTLTPRLSKIRFLSYLVNNYLALPFIETLTQFLKPFEVSPPPRNNRFDDIFPTFFTLKTFLKKIYDLSIPLKFLYEAGPSSIFWEIYPYNTMSRHFIEVPQFLYRALNFIPELCHFFFCYATTERNQFEFEDLRFLVFVMNPHFGSFKSLLRYITLYFGSVFASRTNHCLTPYSRISHFAERKSSLCMEFLHRHYPSTLSG
jgi:hypothetical protein